eukprot:SAG25_NODE_13438_length_267_cov_0.619048_1_plen_27_part_01
MIVSALGLGQSPNALMSACTSNHEHNA